MGNLKEKLTCWIITTIPIFLWIKLLMSYLQVKQTISDLKRNHAKHNCLVRYCSQDGMFGWPDYPKGLQMNLGNYEKLLEPVVYFISTAERSLDICIMLLGNQVINKAIVDAMQKGVKLRVIMDADFTSNHQCRQGLSKQGAMVLLDTKDYIPSPIMHNKYALKDYNPKDGSGLVLCGSLNWAQNSVVENYEHLLLTSSKQVATAFHRNFEEIWQHLQKIEEDRLANDHNIKS